MAPPGLDETDGWVSENADGAPQEIAWRHEVGVEDRDERRLCKRHPVSEGACLVSSALGAPYMRDANPLETPARDATRNDRDGLVVRVVEDLHLEPIRAPVDRAHSVED